MPKSLRTFIAEFERDFPNELVRVGKVVNPASYGVTAIVKHLGAGKRFPILIFERPRTIFRVRCCNAFPQIGRRMGAEEDGGA